MAQWENLGHAATLAQLAGVDALGLISSILQAAQAVRHNRETCLELVQDLQMMEDLLKLLREPEMMRQDEIRNVLNGLDTTLREAGSLVQSCQDCSLAYRIFMGWKQSDQFRRVKKKIAKHLRFYPMVSHADITRRLEELGKSVQSSSSSQQEAQETRTSATSSQNPEARDQVGTTVEIELEPVEIEMAQAGTESTPVEEHQQTGNNENNGSLPTNKWRSRLKLPLPRKKWSWLAQKKGKVEEPGFIRELTGPGFKLFHFTQLCTATDNFAPHSRIEGWGEADFYKGRLLDGLEIMIERRSHVDTSSMGFQREVGILVKLQHTNIVNIIGCCIERGETLLVYEYMTNGRLTDFVTGGTMRFLDWPGRFKIIIGIARGLLYLHECCGMYITLGGYAPLSILLDSHMAPKITDFSIASTYDADGRGTMRNWVRSDVACFGMTLLEIITAKRLRELYDDVNYVPHNMERMSHIIDPTLHGEPQTAEIMRCIQVAVLCIKSDEEDSPSMWDVLLMLSCESVVIPAVPRREFTEASGSGMAYHDAGELSDSDVSGSGMVHHDAGELSDSDVVEPR